MREFPASPMQAAVHTAFLNSLTDSTANTQASIHFGEIVEIPLIHQAWRWMTRYHGLLRSSFKRPSGGVLTLREHEDCEIGWRSLDWTKIPHEEIAKKWQQLQFEDASETIDLTKPPLYRFHVIELPGGMHHLLWTFHSILLDEKSIFLILRDWLRVYNLLRSGQEPPSPTSSLSYAAAIGAIEGADSESASRHWQSTFQDFSNWCPLRPLYAGRKASSHVLVTSYAEFFDRKTTAALKQLVESAGASLATFFMAAWGLVLARTNIDTDAVFGIYRSCRPLLEPQTAETVGLFDSLLPVRLKVPEDLTYKEWLRQLEQEETISTHFLLTSPEEGQTNLRNNLPRFDSTLQYLPGGIADRISMEMPEWTRFDVRLHKASFVPIRVTAYGGERLSIVIESNAYQIPPLLVRQLFDRLLKVIRSFEENPDQQLSCISITLPDEVEHLVNTSSSSSKKLNYPPLLSSFEEIVQQFSNLPAVEKEGESLSFSIINSHSKQVAAFLNTRFQQQPGDITVALAMPLSPNMLIGLLGILRAGYVCLALDPSAASADLKQIFDHYKIVAVLTDDQGSEALGKIQQPSINLDRLREKMTPCSDDLSPLSLKPSDPALFILQSNGERILISHGTLQVALENAIHTYQTNPGDRILCHSLQGSAASLEEYLVALFTGATLVIPGKNIKSTRTAFQETVESGQITHLRMTAAFWSQWVHYLNELGHHTPPSLRRVLIEAGHISRPIIEGWRKIVKNDTVGNIFYSPSGLVGIGTTANEICTSELLDAGIVCGQPQPGTFALITDHRHRFIPSLFSGILLLGTTDTPNEKDQDADLISFQIGDQAWKFLSTGEQARWNENGQLVLTSEPHTTLPEGLTWMDLRLIKEAFTSHPDVMDAIVGKHPSTDNQLCAWVVPRDSHAQLPDSLESHLKEHLPKKWIPAMFALVTRFSLNAFDQIDIASLPQPKPFPATKPKPLSKTTVSASSNISQSPSLSISTLRTGTIDTSLYFIHAGRGLVEDYRPVVQALSGEYGVHCLVVPRGRLDAPTTVEEIVGQLLPVFRLHVSGKFAVAGIGTGAVFAWELARQLDQEHEKDVPFILFEPPPVGRNDAVSWLHKIRKTLLGDEANPYTPSGRFAKLIGSYQLPILPRKSYFFVSGKPDPEWRRRAPLAVWGGLRDTSLLDQPEEIAGVLKDILSPLNQNKLLSSKKIRDAC